MATQKLDPPAKTDDKPTIVDFSKLNAQERLAAFKEAYKPEDLKDVDLYKELNLEKPKIDEQSSKNKEIIESELPKYEAIRTKLAEAGHKFEKVAMSENEKVFAEKIEKQSQAKFKEQETDILKIDEDFPVEEITKMSIQTEDKVTVMATLKGVASRYSEAMTKLKTELDTATDSLKLAKLASPEEDKPDQTGADIVSSKLAEYEWSDLDPKVPTKSDKPDTK